MEKQGLPPTQIPHVRAAIDPDFTISTLSLSWLRLLLVLLTLYLVTPALADDHAEPLTGRDRRTARDLLEKRSEDLSGLEQRLLREIRSGSKDTLTSDERALFDRIQRKLPDKEGS